MKNNTLPSSPFRKACLYLRRALLLRCPTCGKSPVFIPLKKTRSLHDWFAPLDGCPRCGYAYEREPGYFLMSIWAINYGVGSLLGIGLYLFLDAHYELPIWNLIALVMSPIVCFNIFFARHAKSLFLAFDHFCDPHEKEKGNDDEGNLPRVSPTPLNPDGIGNPLPPTTSLEKITSSQEVVTVGK
ncbi:MAG: DUF983 domain-containing protein [Chthoniobacterales bacterium]